MELCQTWHTKGPSMQLLWAHCLLLAAGFDFLIHPMFIFVCSSLSCKDRHRWRCKEKGVPPCSLSELQAYSFAAGVGDSHCDIVVYIIYVYIYIIVYMYMSVYLVELYIIVVDIDNLFRFTCPSYRQLAFRENFRDVAHLLLMYLSTLAASCSLKVRFAEMHSWATKPSIPSADTKKSKSQLLHGSVEDALGGQHNSRTTIIIALPPTRRTAWKFQMDQF